MYQFRLNSLYDPDYTGTGTTAQGFTAYTGMYALFRVLRVRAVVRFYSGTTGQMTVGLIPGLNSTVTSTYSILEGQPFAVSKLLQGNNGNYHSVHEFNVVYDLPKVCGLTPMQYYNDMDFAHSASSNPTKSVYLTCFLNGKSGTQQSVGVSIRMVYEAELSQPLDTVTN